MLDEIQLTVTPHSCGPAIPPLHYASRSMAMYLVHLQEEERGHVTAGSFRLCPRSGHTPAMWRWGPAGSHTAGLRLAMQHNRQANSCHMPRSVPLPWQRRRILVVPRLGSPHEKEAGTEGSQPPKETAALSILNAATGNAGLSGQW